MPPTGTSIDIGSWATDPKLAETIGSVWNMAYPFLSIVVAVLIFLMLLQGLADFLLRFFPSGSGSNSSDYDSELLEPSTAHSSIVNRFRPGINPAAYNPQDLRQIHAYNFQADIDSFLHQKPTRASRFANWISNIVSKVGQYIDSKDAAPWNILDIRKFRRFGVLTFRRWWIDPIGLPQTWYQNTFRGWRFVSVIFAPILTRLSAPLLRGVAQYWFGKYFKYRAPLTTADEMMTKSIGFSAKKMGYKSWDEYFQVWGSYQSQKATFNKWLKTGLFNPIGDRLRPIVKPQTRKLIEPISPSTSSSQTTKPTKAKAASKGTSNP